MKPEDALSAARAAAAEHGEEVPGGAVISPTESLSIEQLSDWAAIQPDPDLMRSTRRLGAPVTFVKRQLLHVMRQYLRELQAQQTRFNLIMLGRVAELEERVEKLEQRAPRGDGPS